MTRPPPFIFPPGRVLAGWWRQLSPLRPRRLWIGRLLLHRVEALAGVAQPVPLDSLDGLILKALAVAPERTAYGVDTCLHLGAQVVGRALRTLTSQGLAQPVGQGEWSLSAHGQQALEQGKYTRHRQERRVFYFVESGEPNRAPRFLHLTTHESAAWPAGEGWSFPVASLLACVSQPADWKQRHGFPLDIQEILVNEAAISQPLPWQQVVLDTGEYFPAAFLLVPVEAGGERLLGFAARQDGWALQTSQPAFTLESDWQEVFPELSVEPSPDEWRQAWLAWCQARGLPALEASACTFEPQRVQLRVTAPRLLIERLRTARSDALKGEAWLLAGSSTIQTAALLEVLEAGGEQQ